MLTQEELNNWDATFEEHEMVAAFSELFTEYYNQILEEGSSTVKKLLQREEVQQFCSALAEVAEESEEALINGLQRWQKLPEGDEYFYTVEELFSMSQFQTQFGVQTSSINTGLADNDLGLLRTFYLLERPEVMRNHKGSLQLNSGHHRLVMLMFLLKFGGAKTVDILHQKVLCHYCEVDAETRRPSESDRDYHSRLDKIATMKWRSANGSRKPTTAENQKVSILSKGADPENLQSICESESLTWTERCKFISRNLLGEAGYILDWPIQEDEEYRRFVLHDGSEVNAFKPQTEVNFSKSFWSSLKKIKEEQDETGKQVNVWTKDLSGTGVTLTVHGMHKVVRIVECICDNDLIETAIRKWSVAHNSKEVARNISEIASIVANEVNTHIDPINDPRVAPKAKAKASKPKAETSVRSASEFFFS